MKVNWKILFFFVALLIGILSLWYMNELVNNLGKEEGNRIELWAKAVRQMSNMQNVGDDIMALNISISSNNSIPVIWTDDKFNIISYRNIDSLDIKDANYMHKQISIMKVQHKPIEIQFSFSNQAIVQYILYKNTPLLEKIRKYQYFQLSVLLVIFLFTLIVFNKSLKAVRVKEKYISQQNILLELNVKARTQQLAEEKEHSDSLLLNILPSEIAVELKSTGSTKAKSFDMVTVMFTDFINFNQASENMNAEELVSEIHTCFKSIDNIINSYNIEKIKTNRDSYMCAGGIPSTNTTHPVDVVSAALEIKMFMEEHKQNRLAKGKEPFEIRIGIHTGPVVAGIVGIKKFAYDIWGDTVNIASRMESSGEVGKVNISGTTYGLVKDQFKCTHRGKIEAKNKGMIEMYFVDSKSRLEKRIH